MAITARFDGDTHNGWVAGEYGERICQWTYYASIGELRVTITGRSEGKMRVIKRGEPIDRNLLARMAIDIAGQIVGKPFDV